MTQMNMIIADKLYKTMRDRVCNPDTHVLHVRTPPVFKRFGQG